ncbi:MAG: hypothetical protein SPLUMA2_SPLUMAMAG2_01128 [uncultured Sulfurimonas sp.]|nr:MAG: hypothetical protein SPLUMA1_SPLUMAMAG1_01350 [uncultured Sulfurimonas sp.]CAI6163607.1 MAG: hypothetical protein SPLUMA2_SPLUMAMAG2_01128 [uncultured Sulfurimonas sp.]
MLILTLLFIFATFIITKIFKTYFVKIDITENRLHLMGNSMLIIEKSEILDIKKVKWYFKNTLSIADDLVEDLYKWIESPV